MKIFSSILMVIVLIGFASVITKGGSNAGAGNRDNVKIVDGKQIVDLTVRGGYSPEKSIAKAGIPTIVRFYTKGTFDCSSSVRIPSMNISKNLELSGTTDIDLGSPKVGILHGTCSMGMYPFEIDFQS